MSAPAIQMSGLPLSGRPPRESTDRARADRTAPRTRPARARVNVLTGSLGRSIVMTAMPSRTLTDSAGDRRPGRGVMRRSTTIAKPIPPAAQTVIRPNCPPRRPSSLSSVVVMRAPGRAERMADRDRSAHHVELRAIDLAHRLGEPGALGPLLRLEALEVREHLRGERLVHLDEVDVARASAPRA